MTSQGWMLGRVELFVNAHSWLPLTLGVAFNFQGLHRLVRKVKSLYW